MKRHLNTSYRLVWNHITGAFVVASELARSRGKRAGVAVALSLAAATSLPAPAADTVVQAGETVSGGTLINHDRQTVSGTADGVTVSTGLELGPDSDDNTGGQQITPGGTARNTTVTADGLQDVMAGGSATDTVISAGGGQNLRGQASGTVLNGGEQWIHAGGSASGTVIMAQNNADRLVIDGGRATGKTILNLVNAGNSASGLATTGKGIRVVEAINGATTEEGAFVQGNRLQAGAFNYSLNRDSDESWYLRSENVYRAEVPLYASMLTQAMDYDRILAGSRSHQTGVNGENNSVRLSIQGGHLGHDNNGGIARGVTPESSGSYGFVRLEGDLLRTEVAGMSVTAGVYGAAGHSSVDVKDDDGSRAGTVRDDAGSLGGYLNLVHTSSGLWADIVA